MHKDPDRTVDLGRLMGELQVRLEIHSMSWRDLGTSIGVSPSTFSRMQAGTLPDLVTFARIMKWLGGGADYYLNISPNEACRRCAHLERRMKRAQDILEGKESWKT